MRVAFIPYVQGRNDYTDGDGLKYGIAIHNTSNDASDEGEAAYATRRTDGVSSHFYGDEDSVTQSIDTADKCGHVGSAIGNENSIACEFKGSNGMSRAWWLANADWDEWGRVLAAVIRHHWPDGSFQVRRASVAEMKANPKVKAFYAHDDCRLAWGGTTHTDPGPNFPWDKLFAVVNAALDQEDDMAYTLPQLQAAPWQYAGRGIADNDFTPEGNISTLGALNFIYNAVKVIAAKVDIDESELAAIRTAAEAGARVALAESVDDFVAGVLAGLDPSDLTLAGVEQAVRNVLRNGVNAQTAEGPQ